MRAPWLPRTSGAGRGAGGPGHGAHVIDAVRALVAGCCAANCQLKRLVPPRAHQRPVITRLDAGALSAAVAVPRHARAAYQNSTLFSRGSWCKARRRSHGGRRYVGVMVALVADRRRCRAMSATCPRSTNWLRTNSRTSSSAAPWSARRQGRGPRGQPGCFLRVSDSRRGFQQLGWYGPSGCHGPARRISCDEPPDAA